MYNNEKFLAIRGKLKFYISSSFLLSKFSVQRFAMIHILSQSIVNVEWNKDSLYYGIKNKIQMQT